MSIARTSRSSRVRPDSTEPRFPAREGENFPTGLRGWENQRMVVLPKKLIQASLRNPLLAPLLSTDMGFYPRAGGHLRQRPNGSPQFIFIWCLAGEGWCELGGRTHALSSGDLLVIPAHEAHAYGSAQVDPWTIAWWHAVGKSLPDFCREFGPKQTRVVRVGLDPYALELFQRIIGILEVDYTPLRLIHASQALGYLLSVLLMCVRAERQSSEAPRYMTRIAQSIVFARENLGRPLNVADLAAVAHLSVPYFHALFRRQTGFAPMDYFIRMRLHRACQLLDTTDQSIQQIATEVGYADPLYFSRLFRSIHDVSPRDYRRRTKG